MTNCKISPCPSLQKRERKIALLIKEDKISSLLNQRRAGEDFKLASY
jgi:hypothetical protein